MLDKKKNDDESDNDEDQDEVVPEPQQNREEIELEIAIPKETELQTDGKWGWFVVFNSFICNMVVDGMQYTFANFLTPIALTFSSSITATALIGSLLSGFYNFSGPLASAMGNKFGFRMVAITGSLISAGGLALSYFAVSTEFLYFSYGVLGGLGFGMIYMASVITTSMHFEKYRALAASISVCGTGIGTFVFSPFGNFLVTTLGWKYALLTEGGMILICIFCGLSFRTIQIMTVTPIIPKAPDKMPLSISETSLRTTGGGVRRGSFVYPLERRRTFTNEAYPTLKEVLLQDEKGSNLADLLSKSGAPSRRTTIDDILSVKESKDEIASIIVPISYAGGKQKFSFGEHYQPTAKYKCRRCCSTCCYNFWHCSCHARRDLNMGERPLYRDDIFYDSTLTQLKFSSSDKLRYHLSIMRIPDLKELEEHRRQKCCTCHQAVLRGVAAMLGLQLLRSKIFNFLCIASFMYTMGLFIPYVFIRNLAIENEVGDNITLWLVSAIGISNTVGRLASGIFKSFVKVNAALLVLICLGISGMFSFIFLICQNVYCFVSYSCVFGFFSAPFISLRPVLIVEFLGLEKLTNAFGLVLLSQGIASILGPPVAGFLLHSTGHSAYTIYMSGGLMILSASALLVSTIFNIRKKR